MVRPKSPARNGMTLTADGVSDFVRQSNIADNVLYMYEHPQSHWQHLGVFHRYSNKLWHDATVSIQT